MCWRSHKLMMWNLKEKKDHRRKKAPFLFICHVVVKPFFLMFQFNLYDLWMTSPTGVAPTGAADRTVDGLVSVKQELRSMEKLHDSVCSRKDEWSGKYKLLIQTTEKMRRTQQWRQKNFKSWSEQCSTPVFSEEDTVRSYPKARSFFWRTKKTLEIEVLLGLEPQGSPNQSERKDSGEPDEQAGRAGKTWKGLKTWVCSAAQSSMLLLTQLLHWEEKQQSKHIHHFTALYHTVKNTDHISTSNSMSTPASFFY